jgi:hypothetical protein
MERVNGTCLKLNRSSNFHSRTVHLDIIKVFYLPTDVQENFFKKNIKIDMNTAVPNSPVRTVQHTYTNMDLRIDAATPPN